MLDHIIWLLIQFIPGHMLMKLVKQRPWVHLKSSLDNYSRDKWKARICWLLRTRCRNASWASSCLSRSLSGRLLFDLIGVANELHLGMSKFSNGCKVPHAWLVDPSSGQLFTPGLTPNAGVPLTKI